MGSGCHRKPREYSPGQDCLNSCWFPVVDILAPVAADAHNALAVALEPGRLSVRSCCELNLGQMGGAAYRASLLLKHC